MKPRKSFPLLRSVFIAALAAASCWGATAAAAPGDPLGPAFEIGHVGARGRTAVARSSGGDFVIVYHDTQSLLGGVSARRFHANGTPNGAAIQVVAPSTTIAVLEDKSVGMDRFGNFVVAWTEWTHGISNAKARRYAADGNPLAAPFVIDETAMVDPGTFAPSVAVGPDGNFVIAWVRSYSSGVYSYNHFIPGCLSALEYEIADPSIRFRQYRADGGAITARGGTVVVSKPGLSLVAYACLTGVSLYVASVGAYGGDTLATPVIAMAADGSFSIAWSLQEGVGAVVGPVPAAPTPTTINVQRYSSAGLPASARQVAQGIPSLFSGFQQLLVPRIAQGTAGTTLVWNLLSYDRKNYANNLSLNARTYGPAGLPRQLQPSAVAAGRQVWTWDDYTPDVAAAPAGAVAVWRSSKVTGSTIPQQINAQWLNANGAPMGPVIDVANSADGLSLVLTAPSVASDANGNFAVFWATLNHDVSDVHLYGRLYSGQ